MSRPTIKDVSRLAEVSIGTVSNVVNGHANVAHKTRERVLDAIAKLGYRTNRAARSLPRGQTGLLGYRMPASGQLNVPLDVFLHQVVESAGALGWEVLLFTPRPGQSELDAYGDVLRRGGVDGFVLASIEYDDARVAFLRERGIPFSAFGRTEGHERSVAVDVDGAEGIRAAVAHLAAQGRRTIGFIGWPEGSLTGDERYRGWVAGMEEAGLEPTTDLVFRSLNGMQRGRFLVPDILRQGCDAVVCVSDHFGLGVMAGLRDADLVAGRDLAVTGFDDISASALVEPGLTSVRQPMKSVAQELVTGLVKILQGQKAESDSGLLIAPELIVRGSSDSGA